MTDAAQPKGDRDFARHHAADADSDRVRRDLLAVVLEKILILLFADVDTAAAAADDHAGFRFRERQPGVVPRFARRDHPEHRRA